MDIWQVNVRHKIKIVISCGPDIAPTRKTKGMVKMRNTLLFIVMLPLMAVAILVSPCPSHAGTWPSCDSDEVPRCEGSGPGMPQICWCEQMSDEDLCRQRCNNHYCSPETQTCGAGLTDCLDQCEVKDWW